MTDDDIRSDSVERFAAWGIIAVGVLLLTLPSLCAWGLFGGRRFNLSEFLNSFAIFSAIPMIVGIFALRWGSRILQRPPRENPPQRARPRAGLGVVLILVALGGVTSCGTAWGVFSSPLKGDTAFYGYGLFGLTAFLGALVILWGLSLILGSQPPRR